MFTVGLVLFVLKGGPKLLNRGDDVCSVLVLYFSNDLFMYFWHIFLDVGSLWESMLAPFSIILASFC